VTHVAAGRASRKENALRLLERVVPGSAPNNLSLAFQVDGGLDARRLRAALEAVMRRHEALRTVFIAEGAELTRTVLDADRCTVELERSELSGEAELTAFVARPFPLDGGLLVRAGYDGDIVCLVLHHLVFDTLSHAPFVRELCAAYEGRLPAGQVAAYHEADPRPESLAYWRGVLRGFDPASLALRCGTPDVAEPTLLGDRVLRTLSPETTSGVRAVLTEVRAPEAVLLLAAYYLLLAGHGAGPDLVVGSPVDTRAPGVAGVIGYHVNVLPLRVRVDSTRTVRELVRAVREVFFESLAHADVPVDDLAAELPRRGHSWRHLLFRHLFNYVPRLGVEEFTIDGRPARSLLVENGYSKFDLELFVLSGADRFRLRAVYGTEFFTRDDVTRLLDRYEALLRILPDALDRPVGELSMYSDRDRAVIEAANTTAAAVHPATVPEAIHLHVAANPGAVALVDGDRVVTYARLWGGAAEVARLLAAAGVTPGDVVAVAARRGAALAAAVLGTWLCGAAYLPVDPEHPAQRIAFQYADSGARAVLAEDPSTLPTCCPALALPAVDTWPDAGAPVAAEPGRPAYLIYTSGSTGTPKGTVIAHGSLANAVTHFGTELAATREDATLWLTTFAFDISALELFVPLVSGGRVVVAPDEARMSGRVLRELIERHGVTILQATPTTWRTVLDDIGTNLCGRRVLCGGEPAPVPLVQRLLDAGCELHHVYGPTETTIWSTSGPVRLGPDRRPDIGRPIANTAVMVADPHGRGLGIGTRGELCIAGAGVAIGYHDRPELTADRFREHPVLGRYYRTGDEARWRPDGTLELLGRLDRQVKIRGNRVELGEVEAAVLRHPQVKAAAVVLVGEPGTHPALVAFVVAADPDGDLAELLWQHTRHELPRALVPQEYVVVEALPTNANEKVDYPALGRLAEDRRRRAGPAEAAEPADPIVAFLVQLWGELLERDDATPDMHFFANGGHSLLGAFLVQRVEEQTGIEIPLADLFSEPTPQRLADRMRR
jgi:amino acid adenylation domain-containing protein